MNMHFEPGGGTLLLCRQPLVSLILEEVPYFHAHNQGQHIGQASWLGYAKY
jgi:hypothetical protein